MMTTNSSYDVTELGYHTPKKEIVTTLSAGEVGYVCASIKEIDKVNVGDTITLENNPASELLPGYKK